MPPQPWNGTYEAVDHGPICPQASLTSIQHIEEGSEDCLFLNIYTKNVKSTKQPVMVYFHGGAYMTGSGNSDMYGPDYLLQHDVILVTINYRLEVLGFLCLDTPDVPGNAGMKDQVAALKWIKNNIEQFGGDPNNVTIFGESAGAASAIYHLFSHMSKGLFNKAIAQSGTAIDDWAIQRDGRERAFRVGKVLGKETEDENELLEFLQSVSVTKLLALTFKTRTEDERYRGLPMYFVPVVEKRFEGVESFLNDEPLDILLGDKTNKVPVMLGYNSAEGLFMVGDQLKKLDFKNKHVKYLVPKEIARKESQAKVQEIGERLKKFYVRDGDFSEENAVALINILTDTYFAFNANRFAYFYAATNNLIFAYRFNYVTELNLGRTMYAMSSLYEGATHIDDLFYLFCNGVNKDVCKEKEELKEIVFKMTKMWTNFAKTGYVFCMKKTKRNK